ncbi:hypothetical protein CYMTET_46343, partial [Cymbomonas tetramitiformis]
MPESGTKPKALVFKSVEEVLKRRLTIFGHTWHETPVARTSHPQVHAKYCCGIFPHFLLPDGRQVHGWYSGSWRDLL